MRPMRTSWHSQRITQCGQTDEPSPIAMRP